MESQGPRQSISHGVGWVNSSTNIQSEPEIFVKHIAHAKVRARPPVCVQGAMPQRKLVNRPPSIPKHWALIVGDPKDSEPVLDDIDVLLTHLCPDVSFVQEYVL